jgi:hypothetical protein
MALWALIVTAIVSAGCSQSQPTAIGADASPGTGGTVGVGTGGASGSGGAIVAGGGTGAVAASASGGATGAGGRLETGGATAVGGTAMGSGGGGPADGGIGTEGGPEDGRSGDGSGGGGGPATGPIVGMPLATFDSNVNNFALNTFAEVGNLANLPAPATMTWIGTDGSPTAGCLKITAPYSGANQWVDIEAPTFPAPLPSWSGRTLHVRIKLDPGSTFAGFARLYVKTGAGFVFYTSAFTPYPQNSGWQEFVLPLVSPAPVPPANPGADPRQIVTFGVDPITSGAPATTPTPVTFYIDSFSIE